MTHDDLINNTLLPLLKNGIMVVALKEALAAKGLVIASKDDVLWLRALNAAGVDNWQGIEHAIDLRDEMLVDAK